MLRKSTLLVLAVTTLFSFKANAGGVGSYAGNVTNSGAAISSGSGSSASTVVNLEFKVPNFMALGVYGSSGSISNPIFASPANNFPSGTTFTASESNGVLLANESNLNSKFDIDGINSSSDAQVILNAINANASATSQDVIIKGAVFTNAPSSTTLYLTTNTNSVTLTGGTGSAPVYTLRSVGGVPGGSITTQNTPATGGLSLTGSRRNSNGYARYAVVGDLSETSVNSSTKGNWTGTITISLTGL